MAKLSRTGRTGAPAVYPYPWPGTRTQDLKGFLALRTRHIDAAVRAIPEDQLGRADLLVGIEADLVDRYLLDELAVGETAIDADVSQQRASTSDPRLLRPGESSRVITVDVFTAMIPISGAMMLLAYWPPNVTAAEPTERVWLDPRVPCIRIPALAELGDVDGATTANFIREQDATIRKLVAATNTAVAQWNANVPEVIRGLVEREKTRLAQSTSQRDKLGFPVATAVSRAIAYRLPRQRPTPRAPIELEHGDYPLLADEDLAEVVAVIRRWADYIPEHPSVIEGKDEPALRDELLHNLNTKWPGTAETF